MLHYIRVFFFSKILKTTLLGRYFLLAIKLHTSAIIKKITQAIQQCSFLKVRPRTHISKQRERLRLPQAFLLLLFLIYVSVITGRFSETGNCKAKRYLYVKLNLSIHCLFICLKSNIVLYFKNTSFYSTIHTL